MQAKLIEACMAALELLTDPEATENDADRVTLILINALRSAGMVDADLKL
jgi:hypothetical protein